MATALAEEFSNLCGNVKFSHDYHGSSDAYKKTQGVDKDSTGYYDMFVLKNESLIKVLVLEISLIILLGIIYYFAIFKPEFKEYKKLQTKGYSFKYYFVINYAYRIIFHLILFSIFFIGFYFLMSTLY